MLVHGLLEDSGQASALTLLCLEVTLWPVVQYLAKPTHSRQVGCAKLVAPSWLCQAGCAKLVVCMLH